LGKLIVIEAIQERRAEREAKYFEKHDMEKDQI
jgi:hypothetical protein